MKPEEYIPIAKSAVGLRWNNLPPYLEIKDLVGEALLGMVEAEYDPSYGVSEKTFYWRKARRSAIEAYRKQVFTRDGNWKYIEEDSTNLLEPGYFPIDAIPIKEAMGTLSERERHVICENVNRGVPIRYVAATMDITANCVSLIKMTALKKMKDFLEAE